MSNQLGLFVVGDSTKCTGCRACEIACFTAHNRHKNGFGYTVGTVTVPVTPKLYLARGEDFCVPVQCKHCEDAPCLNTCEEGAIYRIGHQVIVDEGKCIGCKDCMMACPFGSVTLLPVSDRGEVMTQEHGEARLSASKCDLCIGIKDGPACVRACPNHALRLVDPVEEHEEKKLKAALSLVAQSDRVALEESMTADT